jgi:glycosyltransferase involved in cell wall biosynthesis
MPALNEEKNILDAVNNTLKSFDDYGIKGEIIVINDGSTDKTRVLAEDVLKKDSRVRLIKHNTPQGIGASFWDGVDNAHGDMITMLQGDNENDP